MRGGREVEAAPKKKKNRRGGGASSTSDRFAKNDGTINDVLTIAHRHNLYSTVVQQALKNMKHRQKGAFREYLP